MVGDSCAEEGKKVKQKQNQQRKHHSLSIRSTGAARFHHLANSSEAMCCVAEPERKAN